MCQLEHPKAGNDAKVVPMIHVPNVAATVEWYRNVGFDVLDTFGNDSGGLSFAILSFGKSQVMFNQGGRTSGERRREVDLYIHVDDVDAVYERLKEQVEVVHPINETFYGMREFIVRDLNRFWMTFAQPTASATLTYAIQSGNADSVRNALDSGKHHLDAESLTAALAAARAAGSLSTAVEAMLIEAGAVLPPEFDESTLRQHAGKYRSESGMEVDITFSDRSLFAAPRGQPPGALVALNETTFKPVLFEGITLTFSSFEDQITGFVYKHGGHSTELKRASEDIQ